MKNFGSSRMPLRASLVPQLIRCELSGVYSIMTDGENSGGKAADTGSAVHMAARVFHTVAEGNVSVSIGVMREAVALYPFADLDAAEVQFRYYAKDPRNQKVTMLLCEEKVKVRVKAAKDDPTQEEIVINGTVDQVREENGQLIVWDIKTGATYEGLDMIHAAAMQLAIYQVGAAEKLGRPVTAAGVIRTKDYLKKTQGAVFWRAPWRMSDTPLLMQQIAQVVARVRRGEIQFSPSGDHCRWCPLGGLGNCIPKLKELA